MTTETVYTGTNDEISFVVNTVEWNELDQKFDYDPIPFVTNGVTKVEISFADQAINSIDNAGMISFNDNGEIILKLNSLTSVVKNRSHPATIKVFDPTHPLGQTPVDPTREDSNLSLIFV